MGCGSSCCCSSCCCSCCCCIKHISQPESEPDPKPEPKPEPKPDLKLEPKTEPIPEPKPVPKLELKHEPQSEPESDPKPEPKSKPNQDEIKKPERRKSIPVVPEPMAIARFSKISFHKRNPLELIEGYQNELITSLEEALAYFKHKIPRLSKQVKAAKRECRYPSDHGLTQDESAAIYLYSMRGENNVYEHLETAWSSWDRSQMEPWFKYLNLLKSALDKIPNVKTEIWQGITFDKDLETTLRTEPLQLYTCMGSCLSSRKEIKDHFNGKSVSRAIFIGYESVDGKDVTAYTQLDTKEIMMWPGVKLNKAKEIEVDSYGSLHVHFVRKIGEYYSTLPIVIFIITFR
jgi:hypothetical protein